MTTGFVWPEEKKKKRPVYEEPPPPPKRGFGLERGKEKSYPYPLMDEDTDERIEAYVKSDFSVWIEDEFVGTHNPETGEFTPQPEEEEMPVDWRAFIEAGGRQPLTEPYREVAKPALKGIEWILSPFTATGIE